MIKEIIQLLGYPIPLRHDQEMITTIIAIADQHGFDRYKLEKDFWLTVLLINLGRQCPELTFKWGTCLNKIYFQYYRLSEDLDFTLIYEGNRTQTKQLLEHYKQLFASSTYTHLWLQLSEKRTKFNEDTQWCFELVYTSLIDHSLQAIKVDIRIEPTLLLPILKKPIWSIFTDQVLWDPIFQNDMIHVMHLDEIAAEKMRAALTRNPSAIRDFFDIWYMKQQWFDFTTIRSLIQQKIWSLPYTIPDNADYLQPQIASDLAPVLWGQTQDFNLSQIFPFISSFKN